MCTHKRSASTCLDQILSKKMIFHYFLVIFRTVVTLPTMFDTFCVVSSFRLVYLVDPRVVFRLIVWVNLINGCSQGQNWFPHAVSSPPPDLNVSLHFLHLSRWVMDVFVKCLSVLVGVVAFFPTTSVGVEGQRSRVCVSSNYQVKRTNNLQTHILYQRIRVYSRCKQGAFFSCYERFKWTQTIPLITLRTLPRIPRGTLRNILQQSEEVVTLCSLWAPPLSSPEKHIFLK